MKLREEMGQTVTVPSGARTGDNHSVGEVEHHPVYTTNIAGWAIANVWWRILNLIPKSTLLGRGGFLTLTVTRVNEAATKVVKGKRRGRENLTGGAQPQPGDQGGEADDGVLWR